MEPTFHFKTSLSCDICDQRLSSKANLQRHMISLHGVYDSKDIDEPSNPLNKIYSCERCNKTYITKKYYNKHCEVCNITNVQNQRLSCPNCNKRFSNPRSIYRHSKICKGKPSDGILIPSKSPLESSIVAEQVANTIHNTNNIDTQNNIQNQTNNNNIIIVYNPKGIDFNKDHIDQDAFIQRILEMYMLQHHNPYLQKTLMKMMYIKQAILVRIKFFLLLTLMKHQFLRHSMIFHRIS